jgi:DNA replication protein DnaC
MIAGDTDLDALFKRLHLANARRVWRDVVERAEREAWAYRDFLTLLATEEIAHRQQTRLARLTRRAHFPFLKTIDDFNFTYQSSLRLHMLGSTLTPDFVTEGRSLILAGKPGRGKTHLAIAIAYRAIQNDFDAFFTTAAALIDDLSAAFRAGELANALPTYTHPAVLIVDEVGYLTYGTDAANMLFHVVNERHRRHRPMIFTTNKALKAWGRVLHDEDLAQAIIDRVLERGRLLRLDGPSIRTLHVNLDDAMKEDSDQDADLVRISGKRRSEFPEPTPLVPAPPEPAVFYLIEHMEGLVAQLRKLRPPAGSAAHGTIIEDGADDKDFLTVVDLIPEGLKHLAKHRAVGVPAIHEPRDIGEAHVACLKLFMIQDADAASAGNFVPVEREVDFVDAARFCACAERRFGARCAAAEQDALGWLHRGIIT